jgi:hypothetical protein
LHKAGCTAIIYKVFPRDKALYQWDIIIYGQATATESAVRGVH